MEVLQSSPGGDTSYQLWAVIFGLAGVIGTMAKILHGNITKDRDQCRDELKEARAKLEGYYDLAPQLVDLVQEWLERDVDQTGEASHSGRSKDSGGSRVRSPSSRR